MELGSQSKTEAPSAPPTIKETSMPSKKFTVTIRMGALHNDLTAGSLNIPLSHPEASTKREDRKERLSELAAVARTISDAMGLKANPKAQRKRKRKPVGGAKTDEHRTESTPRGETVRSPKARHRKPRKGGPRSPHGTTSATGHGDA